MKLYKYITQFVYSSCFRVCPPITTKKCIGRNLCFDQSIFKMYVATSHRVQVTLEILSLAQR